MSKKNIGSSIDDCFKEEGILEEAQAEAVKEVVGWQIAEAMKKNRYPSASDPAAEDNPHADRLFGSEKRCYAVEPTAGGGDGWAAGTD